MPVETPIRFHPEADDELHVTADWYDEHGGHGDDFLEAVKVRIDDEGVLIVAIAHQSREHLYWRGR